MLQVATSGAPAALLHCCTAVRLYSWLPHAAAHGGCAPLSSLHHACSSLRMSQTSGCLPAHVPTHPPHHTHLPACPADVVTGPIRLLFPRIPNSIGEASGFPFSLLGEPRRLGCGGAARAAVWGATAGGGGDHAPADNSYLICLLLQVWVMWPSPACWLA